MHKVGDVLAGKYRLVRSIGKGGMGEVFEAEHGELRKRFAIKIPTAELMGDKRNLERFKREPQMAAATGHRSIVDVYDINVTDQGIPFVVMEYLEGEAFSELIRREGKVEVALATYVIAQVLSALTATHAKGIIHRDLKPDNIFLVYSNQPLPDVKLLDFGTSKVVAHDAPISQGLTQSGTILGTPYYMAPEQVRADKHLDGRLDVYAAGVILYEALTGQVPFYSDNVYTLVHMVLHEELTPPRVYRGDLPADLEAVILKAMDRDRERRFASAEEMLRALLPHMDELSRMLVWVPEATEPGPGLPASRRSTAPLREGARAAALPTAPAHDGDGGLLLGRYALLKRLVKGQTGTVYFGRAEGTSGFRKPVAIKVIHSHLTEDAAAVRALVQEARLAARIVHPSLVQVSDFGEHGGRYVAVMEYVHAHPLDVLSQYLASYRRPMALEHAVFVVWKVLQGLSFAHRLRDEHGSPLALVHGGIAPSRVLVSIDGQVKLTGFGVGRSLAEMPGAAGSGRDFAHLTPEQVNGEPIDARTDLFAVGTLLYETLTGSPLFGAGGDALTVTRVASADVPDIRNYRPDLPPEVSEVLRTALAQSPDERYQTAEAFGAALRELLGGASPDDVEPIFRALVAQTLNEDGFKSTAGQLFDLARALEGIPIPLGQPVAAREAEPEPVRAAEALPASRPRRSRLGLLLAAVAVLLLAGGGVAGFALFSAGRGDGAPRRPVVLIIDQQPPDAAAPATDAAPAADARPDVATPADAGLASPEVVARLVDADRPGPTVRPPQPLTGRVVTETLMRRQAQLLGCVRTHQATAPEVRIEAIRVVIDGSGAVSSASVEPASANATPLGQCIAAVARATRFPRHTDQSAAFRVPARLGGG